MDKKYFKLQLKSIFKIYPMILLITTLTVLSIISTCVLVLQKQDSGEKSHKLSVGIVGDMEDTYLSIGLDAIKTLDSSSFYIDIVEMTEEDAKKALEKREIVGYLNVPEDYIRSVYVGENIPAEYITLSAPAGFGTMISNEIVEMISNIVTESQNGMYSMQEVAHKYNDDDLGSKIDRLMFSYAEHIFQRTDMYEIETIGVSDSVSFAGYYLCGLIILFMMLWGISCNRFFSTKNTMYFRLLKISGMNASKQMLCEYSAYFIISAFTLLSGAFVFGVVLQFNDFGIVELVGMRIIDCMIFVVKISPVIIMITAMHTLFYEMIPNIIGSVLAQFLTTVLLGYFSGCFYPNYFFPELVQKIFYYLPIGAGFAFLRKIMSGVFPWLELGLVAFYIVIFMYVAVRIRNTRITGDIK